MGRAVRTWLVQPSLLRSGRPLPGHAKLRPFLSCVPPVADSPYRICCLGMIAYCMTEYGCHESALRQQSPIHGSSRAA
jgi:hypothetical protein